MAPTKLTTIPATPPHPTKRDIAAARRRVQRARDAFAALPQQEREALCREVSPCKTCAALAEVAKHNPRATAGAAVGGLIGALVGAVWRDS